MHCCYATHVVICNNTITITDHTSYCKRIPCLLSSFACVRPAYHQYYIWQPSYIRASAANDSSFSGVVFDHTTYQLNHAGWALSRDLSDGNYGISSCWADAFPNSTSSQAQGHSSFRTGAIAQQNRASKISSSISPSEWPLLKVACGSQLPLRMCMCCACACVQVIIISQWGMCV